jgi:hypothetical protein
VPPATIDARRERQPQSRSPRCTFPHHPGISGCRAARQLRTRLVRVYRLVSTVLSTASLLLLAVFPAHAQMGSGAGFLFRVPTLRLGASGGFAAPRGQSDIYDFLTDELTLERGGDEQGAECAGAYHGPGAKGEEATA